MQLNWHKTMGTGCNKISRPNPSITYSIYYCEGVFSLYFCKEVNGETTEFLLANHTTVDRAKTHAQTHFDAPAPRLKEILEWTKIGNKEDTMPTVVGIGYRIVRDCFTNACRMSSLSFYEIGRDPIILQRFISNKTAKKIAQDHFDKYCDELSKNKIKSRYRVYGTMIVANTDQGLAYREVCNIKGYYGETGEPLAYIFCKLLNKEYEKLKELGQC